MATYNAYAPYFIYFCNQHEYDFALAVTGGSFITLLNPEAAAAIFAITWPPTGSVQQSRGIYGIDPYGIPGPGGVEIKNPAPSGVFLKTNLDSVTVPGQTGVPNIFGTGPDLIISWVGIIIKGADVFNRVTSPATVRRWIGGMETARLGEGGNNDVVLMTRDASRFGDGFGLAVRGGNTGNLWQRQTNEYTGVTPRSSDEVFYFRIRTIGSVDLAIWRCRGSVSPSAGVAFKILTDGKLRLVSIDSGGTETTLTTTVNPLDMNTWYRIEVAFQYNSGVVGQEGAVAFSINHDATFAVQGLVGTGLGQVQLHASSDLGKVIASADTTFEVDLDDWSNVTPLDPFAPGPAIDGLMGSHIFSHDVESGVITNWTGVVETANDGINPIANLNSLLTSTTALALLDLLTDVTDTNKTAGMSEGKVAAVIGSFSSNSGATDGKLGYNAAGAGNVLTTVNQTAVGAMQSVLYNPGFPAGFPPSIVPFRILHEKSNDGNTDSTRYLGCTVEHIGVFGKEDALGSQFFPATLMHNCRYANTAWGYIGALPTAPVYAVGGTYVGNGGTLTVNLPAPCHFLWIRALAGGAAGIKWFGAGIGGHFSTQDRVVPNAPVRVFIDSTGQCKFTVTGTDVEVNTNLANYQYIAFCDPGMRYNICGAFQHPTTLGLGVNLFPDSTFIPTFAFAQGELTESISSGQTLSCKGPGHSGTTGTSLNGTALANWGSFPLLGGELDSGASLHQANNQVNYSVWRNQDILCSNVMIQTGFYTGNGAGGTRTFTGLTPTSNRFPLFILVQPHNAAGFMKDPSHAGANSANVQTLANSATAITAVGVDSFTVGTTLNANGIIYEFFIICGDSAGFNNGTFGPPNCEAPSDFFIPPTLPPDDIIAVAGDGGLTLGAAVAVTILKDVSGLYKLTPGKLNDTVYNRISGASTEVQAIPNPSGRTAFISG